MSIFDKKKFNLYLIFILLLSLLVGFYFNEDSTGGAKADYIHQKKISIEFSKNFKDNLLNYDKNLITSRHSPIIPIYFSIYEKFKINDNFIRIIHLPISLIIMFFFYLCLKKKYLSINKFFLISFASLVLLSPTIRSLSIWPDSRIYGLIFFIVSIFCYLNFIEENSNNKKNLFLLGNIFSLVIASYISPNFCLFSIWYLFMFYKHKVNILYLLMISFILAIPAIYYVFFLKIYFFTMPAIAGIDLITRINPVNKIILISSIIFFHLIPLVIAQHKLIINTIKNTKFLNFIIFFLLTLIFYYYFNYPKKFIGGGIFFHLSNLFESKLLIILIGLISLYYLIIISQKKFENFFLIFCIFASNPQLSIFHKYYDPMILIIFFTLFNMDKREMVFNSKYLGIFYIHSLLFLIANLIK